MRDAYTVNPGIGDYVACAVDKWVYLDINVAELIFSKNGELHTVPVASNTVDSFGNLDVSGDPMINGPADIVDEISDHWGDFWEDFSNFLLWIGVAIAVFIVLLIVFKLLRRREKKESVTINIVDPNAHNKKHHKE